MQSSETPGPTNALEFTQSQDWFSHNTPIWKPLLVGLRDAIDHSPRALEIGSWEGRSATFICQTLCTHPASLLVCIDHFDLLNTDAGKERYRKLIHNLDLVGSPFRVMDSFSVPALMTLLEEDIANPTGGFDFIYLDGSHEADDTCLDAELAWRLARDGALIVLDDYEWDKEPADSIHHPKRGVDAFLSLHAGEFEFLHKGYQIILRKTVQQRIGFLTKLSSSAGAAGLATAFEYGINIVTCADSAYAAPVAVALRSAALSTPNIRITFYVLDCGLDAQDKERIRSSVPVDPRLSMVFLQRPDPNAQVFSTATWAKIDMLPLLPVERILYLDADVLVRHDLTPLWRTDLGTALIGATRDIGHPLGHSGVPRGPYFNVGVMVLDLARIRPHFEEISTLMTTRMETAYKDQDVLNVFFANKWKELPLTWNATGLGTYALSHAPDREAVWASAELKALHEDPALIHFTGPVHPTAASVLNEYIQPWTSKPWGYAGAPGHPYAQAWWDQLEDTAWKGWRYSAAFRSANESARKHSEAVAMEEFSSRLRRAGSMET